MTRALMTSMLLAAMCAFGGCAATPIQTAAPVKQAEPTAYRFDCGAPSDYTDKAGNVWKSDAPFRQSPILFVSGSEDRGNIPIKNTDNPKIYQTEAHGNIFYEFRVPNGAYRVVLHFAETFATAEGERVFHVLLQHKKVLTDFDPFKEAGGQGIAVVREFSGVMVTNGVLSVGVVAGKEGHPEINGIELYASQDGIGQPAVAVPPQSRATKDAVPPTAAEPAKPLEKIFVLINVTRTPEEFSQFAKQVSRMKKYGRVLLDISAVSSLAQHEIPPGGSPWHEYNYSQSVMFKFFPDPKLAPFLPAPWIENNRKLILAKAKILRDMGMEASFSGYEGYYYPEAFFEAYPYLRGPRTDMPRRTRTDAYSACVDHPETLAMATSMMAEFKRNVPELACYYWRTNDCGGGICWSNGLYNGANGPRPCMGRNMGDRIHGLLVALHKGAQEGGGDIPIHIFSSNFTEQEIDEIVRELPPNTHYDGRSDRSTVSCGSGLSATYPVMGLLNPVAIIARASAIRKPTTETVDIRFDSMYDRVTDLPDAIEKTLDIVEETLNASGNPERSTADVLDALALKWGGNRANADKLVAAFRDLNDVLKLNQTLKMHFQPHYNGVTLRYITRPLVFRPEALTSQEESYFLPYVFNRYLSEARNDYIDWHGLHLSYTIGYKDMGQTYIPEIQSALSRAVRIAATLENTQGWPAHAWLKDLGTSLRLWASLIRSCNNFYFAQVIRDRNKDAIAAGPHVPPKCPALGDPDILQWYDLLRDEFDNTQELIAILEKGGSRLLHHADKPEDEDMFELGPDVVGALRMKSKIMRAHWCDVEDYLTHKF